eukprot:12383588-Karenia_brevis.AAC.1
MAKGIRYIIKYCAAPAVFASTWLLLREFTNCTGVADDLATMHWPYLKELWMYATVNVSYTAALLFSWHWQLDAHTKYCNLLTSSLVFFLVWNFERFTSAAWMSFTYVLLPTNIGWYGKRKSTDEDMNDKRQGCRASDFAASSKMRSTDKHMQELQMRQSSELTTTIFKAVEALHKKTQPIFAHKPVNFDFDIVEAWCQNNM